MRAAIRERWGDDAVGDRQPSARSSSRDRGELEWLERCSTGDARGDRRLVGADDAPLAAVEIPLLYETGGESRFDQVVVDHRAAETREARRRASPIAERG